MCDIHQRKMIFGNFFAINLKQVFFVSRFFVSCFCELLAQLDTVCNMPITAEESAENS